MGIVLGCFLISIPHAVGQEEKTPPATATVSSDTTGVKADSLFYTRPEYSYQTLGRRDPFETLAPREKDEEEKVIKGLFNYEKAKIVGIVNTDDGSCALVNDENGLGYVLRQGDRVFGGYVTDVTDNALYLHIVKYGRSMTIILRMEFSKQTVIEEQDGFTSVKKPGINITFGETPAEKKEVIIEEITVPSADIRTIEEEWFGPREKPSPLIDESVAPEKTGTFMLLEPPDNSWIRLPYILEWTDAEGTNVEYTLIIDDNSDFSSPLVNTSGITRSSFLLTDGPMFPRNRELYWKVIAVDESGERSIARQPFMKFKIAGQ